ncbi:MAG TPA: GNAT family N-acetyltransferase [Candidatus Methylomirabilis sp.]|nr:GNAT family N-acetyltransferase [Candidatus Methylomirabilis sp.]
MTVERAAERQIARITLAAERDYLAALIAFLRTATGRLGLPASDAAGLERAVQEVCLNIVEHGFEPGQAGSFDVTLLRRPGHIVLAVEDQGMPFDFERLEAAKEGGLAAPALTGLADVVRFLNLGTRGNRVELHKRLPFRAIDAYIAAGQAPPVAAPSAPPLTLPVTVRLMTPDDAIGVARSTYAVYGYTLPDDYLYFPDRIREMLQGGLLEVVVAVLPDGEIVGCMTSEVEHPGGPVGYLGEGLVDPRVRHHGLMEQMLRFMQRRATERGMLGLYGEAVTVHPYSQMSNIALGFTVVGVQLGDEAPTVDFKAINREESKKRTATVLNFLRTSEGPHREVYVPPQHKEMIERIYAQGKLPRTLVEREPAVTAEASSAQVRVDASSEWSEGLIRVTAYGPDLTELVRFRLRELCLRRIDWICLDLPLSDPGARRFCASLEALGFFFCGVIPDLVGDDILRLQYLNEIEAEVEAVQIASEFGKEVFAYVVRAMNAATGDRRG